ncbi:MAG: phosphatase PAP2 family protein [Lachnospiraceae bacterium]|nr:phosphatase PAP2 family protein [Lachnospiraceae bacterium]
MMNEQLYKKLSAPFCRTEKCVKTLIYTNKILTASVYLAYPVALYAAYRRSYAQLLMSVVIPGIFFVLLSVFRDWYDAPRPYEKLDIEPIIKKDTKGHSFPSRHVFSAFMIDMVIFPLSKVAGIVYFVIAVLIACIRVLGGVHFPKDVIVGALAGIIGWFIGCGFFHMML